MSLGQADQEMPEGFEAAVAAPAPAPTIAERLAQSTSNANIRRPWLFATQRCCLPLTRGDVSEVGRLETDSRASALERFALRGAQRPGRAFRCPGWAVPPGRCGGTEAANTARERVLRGTWRVTPSR